MDISVNSITNTPRLFLKLVGPTLRKDGAILICLLFLGMLFELIGLSAMLPIIAILATDGQQTAQSIISPETFKILGWSHAALVRYSVIGLVLFFATKTLFQTFVTWRLAEFTYALQADLSYRLFDGYLHQPYSFFLQRNSAHLSNSVNDEANQAGLGLYQAVVFLAEAMVAVGIILLVIIAVPLVGIAVMAFVAVIGFVMVQHSRAKLSKWGDVSRDHQSMKMHALQQGIEGVKDVKLFGDEERVLEKFQIHSRQRAEAGKHYMSLQALPRLWLEFLAVLGMATMILLFQFSGYDSGTWIPLLGFVVIALIRLVPSANRIVMGLQSLRFYRATVEKVVADLQKAAERSETLHTSPLTFQSNLQIDRVSFTYPGGKDWVLNDVKITIPKGAIVGIDGSSGTGKSTLLDIILGLLPPTTGSVTTDGVAISENLADWQRRIGYVAQSIYIYDDSVRRNIALGQQDDQIDDQLMHTVLCAAKLDKVIANLPEGLGTILGERGIRLSGGQRQRIGIARALYRQPSLLILDEATSALDIETETDVMKSILAHHGQVTIIIASHRPSVMQSCDFVYSLKDREMFQSS
ncbi:ABC transporter ATP-binding protein [Parasphingorhabdus sp.]|uniref:ABC transporter ATP-binding protein n=1 Tax=Parasphingorhabdus sp. TaxID=2709688 RepID=UPI003D2694B7